VRLGSRTLAVAVSERVTRIATGTGNVKDLLPKRGESIRKAAGCGRGAGSSGAGSWPGTTDARPVSSGPLSAHRACACHDPLTNRIKIGDEAFVIGVGEGPDGQTDLYAAPAGGGAFTRG
jgi:hypothetical protein